MNLNIQMQDKERFRQLCTSNPEWPIYFNDWYLDSTCGSENWDVILYFKGDVLLGFMTYFTRKSFFLGKRIKMPPITPFMGPYLIYPEGIRQNKIHALEKEILTYFIQKLPRFSYFNVRCHHSLKNTLPFMWKGFSQTNMFTYDLTLDNLDDVFNNFKSSVRGKIRKADKIVNVEIAENPELFFKLNSMSFDRQSVKIPYDLDLILRMDSALAKNDSRTIFFASDKDNNYHSALYLTHDKRRAYVHLVGEDPNFRNSGAGTLIVWEAIKYTFNELKLREFDFEGSTIERIEENRRSYGSTQRSYSKLTKVNSFLMRMAFAAKMILGK